MKDIGNLLKLNKKIIWTQHDEWAFTGGCHYTSGCVGYLNNCRECIQLNPKIWPLAELTYLEKAIHYSNHLELVSPSKWLAQKAKNSPLFKNTKIHVISNSLENEWFNSYNKWEIRKKYGISSDCFVVGFGADSISEKRKGITYLIEAFDLLMENEDWKLAFESKKIILSFFGNYSGSNRSIEKYANHLGSFSNDKEIAEIYQMMDIFVIPSMEDNLPNTMLESMASKTPVLGFPIGGIVETIRHNENGFLADSISSSSLAEQLYRIWKDLAFCSQVGESAYQYAREKFSMDNQALAYNDIFVSVSRYNQVNSNLEKLTKEKLNLQWKVVSDKLKAAYLNHIKSLSWKSGFLNLLFYSRFISDFIQSYIKKK
ncbi:glycosyltransferase [Leptospira sp. WS39.C2]